MYSCVYVCYMSSTNVIYVQHVVNVHWNFHAGRHQWSFTCSYIWSNEFLTNSLTITQHVGESPTKSIGLYLFSKWLYLLVYPWIWNCSLLIFICICIYIHLWGSHCFPQAVGYYTMVLAPLSPFLSMPLMFLHVMIHLAKKAPYLPTYIPILVYPMPVDSEGRGYFGPDLTWAVRVVSWASRSWARDNNRNLSKGLTTKVGFWSFYKSS